MPDTQEAPRAARTRATALPPEERRTTIIEATIPLLLEHGDGVTTRQIADATGVAEGTIFRVFPDKDAVIEAALEHAIAATPLGDFDRIPPDAPMERRLAEAVSIIQQRVVSVWKLLSAVGPRFHDPARRPQSDSLELVSVLTPHAEVFDRDVDAAARILRSLTLALTHPLLATTPLPADEIVKIFLHGVTKESPC